VDDQIRTLSAAEALRVGASYLVVGRPIIRAADPRAAALQILSTVNGATNRAS
jgi:orotidine-5'-phosphate decarboxylase